MTEECQPSILVVDDNEANRYFKVKVLGDLGCRIREAACGADALRELEAEPPTLVLLDVRLPDMDGLDICRHIKSTDSRILVLQTSALFRDVPDRVAALDSGADGYLVEPIDPDELVASIRALLRLHKAEQQLRAANASLDELFAARTRDLEDARRRYAEETAERARLQEALRHAEKLDALGQLTGGVAHDFNNLLTVVVGNLEMAALASGGASGEPRPRLKSLIDTALQAALNCERLTSQLLAFARRDRIRFEVVDLNPIIARYVPLMQRAIGEGMTMELELGAELWACRVDPRQLETVLLNLAVNARDAMPRGGKMTIRTANVIVEEPTIAHPAVSLPPLLGPGSYVHFSLADQGTGMSEEVLAHAIDPFFTTKDVGQGSGLGLSQVYGFVKQCAGQIVIDSKLGKGTRVNLFFPRVTGAVNTVRPQRDEIADPPGGCESILVVEDNEMVLEMATTILVELGYRVLRASDGVAALDVVRREAPIDLLFTDIVMPNRMSGLDLARAARELRPDLKVLLTSGYSAYHRDTEAVREFPTITKPYRSRDLARRIREVLVS
jgi:signal transduction histidine kinase